MMFVVQLQFPTDEPENSAPLKAFSHRAEASSFAKTQIDGDAERADLYEVIDINDARLAVEAVRAGRANWVKGYAPHASEAELG